MAAGVSARSLTSRRAVARELLRHGSPYVIGTAVAVAGAVRLGAGPALGVADLVTAVSVALLQPVVEWTVHRWVLHAPARRIGPLRADPGAAHRGHHRVPDDVAGALLGPGYAVGNTVLLAAAVGAGGAALSAVTGAPVGAVVPTAIAAAAVGLGAYEWVHLLVHTGYPGRRAWYRALRAQHRLHHYRDDGTGFGITARWVDRALGTAPARPGGAGRSPAARAG